MAEKRRSDTPLFRFVVRLGEKARAAGYIDANGHVVIPAIFEDEGDYGYDDFFDGIALAPMVLPFTFDKYQSPTMKEPLCAYSFIDRAGGELIPRTFRDAKDFAEGVAPVGDGKPWGYVDVNGNFAVPLQYQNAEPFSEGLAAVLIKGKWGYVNHAGMLAIRRLSRFPEGVALTIDAAGQYRFIDKTGSSAIPGSFTGASSFVMGRAHVRSGVNYETATWAYIDHAGHVIFRYSEMVSEAVSAMGDQER